MSPIQYHWQSWQLEKLEKTDDVNEAERNGHSHSKLRRKIENV